MVKNGEDWHRLQTAKLKILGLTFQIWILFISTLEYITKKYSPSQTTK